MAGRSDLIALDLSPRLDHVANARWVCCDGIVERAFNAAEAAAASYTGWTDIFPWPRCERCGGRMLIAVATPLVVERREAATRLLTRTEMKDAREKAERIKQQMAIETPLHETLMPFGEFGGKRMCDVPPHELHRVRQYYASGRRRDKHRARELVAAIDAAIAWHLKRPDTEFPRALIDPEDDGLPF